MPLHEVPFHSHEERALVALAAAFALERVNEARTVDHRSVCSKLFPTSRYAHSLCASCNERKAAFMRSSITTPPLLQSPGTECYDLFLIRAHSIMAPLECTWPSSRKLLIFNISHTHFFISSRQVCSGPLYYHTFLLIGLAAAKYARVFVDL